MKKLTQEQASAITEFKARYGRSWKTELNSMWLDGRDAREPGGNFLRQIRNTLGPAWLEKVKVK